MTFWQGVAIQAMSSFDLVDARAALQIQSLLICIEMLIASVAHYYVFPYHEWQPDHLRQVLYFQLLCIFIADATYKRLCINTYYFMISIDRFMHCVLCSIGVSSASVLLPSYFRPTSALLLSYETVLGCLCDFFRPISSHSVSSCNV